MSDKWVLKDAIEVIVKIEEIAKSCNWHVGLTGGVLYKEGERKDLDIIFYRVRQTLEITNEELLGKLFNFGFSLHSNHGWCVKATYADKCVALLFPELTGDYPIIGVDLAAGDDKTVIGSSHYLLHL